jgi:hypothetical protein
MLNFVQHGSDGFGHQLHGLFSSLILTDIRNYNFDAYSFIKKKFYFQHLSIKEEKQVQDYMIQVVNLFRNLYNPKKLPNNFYINIIDNVSLSSLKNYNEKTLYGIDNAYYFDKFEFNEEEEKIHNDNIINMKSFFINRLLPLNRLETKHIVIHIRTGSNTNPDLYISEEHLQTMNTHKLKIVELIDILNKKFENYKYYIHYDSYPIELVNKLKNTNCNYELFDYNTPILNVLADFIYARIFIAGVSSLSKVSTFLGHKKLIIINDDNKHSVNNQCIKISDYINQNKKKYIL